MKEKNLNIKDIYIGLESKDIYIEEVDDYAEIENIVSLEKENYYLECNNIKVTIYKDLNTGSKVYLKNDNSVFHQISEDIDNHYIEMTYTLKEMVETFEQEEKNPTLKSQVYPSYKIVKNIIENNETIKTEDFYYIQNAIINLYIYHISSKDLEIEEEKENNICDFEKAKIRKKSKN